MVMVTVDYSNTDSFGVDAADSWATAYTAVHTQENTWKQTLATIVGTVGIVQQFALNTRMVDLAERGVDIARDQYDLTERNYTEISLPAYTRAAAYYDDCIADMKTYIRTMLEDGIGATALTVDDVDYDLHRGRAEMQVVTTFGTARRNIASRYGKYRTGAICNQNLRLDSLEALARVDAADKAFRFAEQRKEVLEDRVFDRKLRAAQLAYSVSTLSMNGLFQGVSGTTSALGATGRSVSNVLAANAQLSDSFQNLGNFWGTLANGAFSFLGYSQGGSPLSGVSNPFNGTATNSNVVAGLLGANVAANAAGAVGGFSLGAGGIIGGVGEAVGGGVVAGNTFPQNSIM